VSDTGINPACMEARESTMMDAIGADLGDGKRLMELK